MPEPESWQELQEIIILIEAHHVEFPAHGTNCACLDKYIQRLRKLTESNVAQNRVDYVLRSATENRR